MRDLPSTSTPEKNEGLKRIYTQNLFMKLKTQNFTGILHYHYVYIIPLVKTISCTLDLIERPSSTYTSVKGEMSKPSGGLKGLLQTTGKTIFSAGVIVRDYGTIAARWGYKIGGNVAFVMATTSMIVLMPLIFESTREVQVCL
jgi:hypothetical protein